MLFRSDSGKYIPEIVKKEDVESTLLLPTEIKELLVKDIKAENFNFWF